MYRLNMNNSFQVSLLFVGLFLLLVGCGSTNLVQPSKITTPTTSNNNAEVIIDADKMVEAIEDSHEGHQHHGLKSLIARMNTNAVIENDKAALSEMPRKEGGISFAQSLQPLFTGSPRVEMKLLIISAAGNPTTADASDPVLDGIRYFAQEIGIPHDVLIATTETLTEDQLVAVNGDGKYQGIIVTETGLLYNNNGLFESAFSEAEWNLLWQYEREFNVRHLAMSGFPGTFPEDYGLRNVSQSGNALTAKLTTDGVAIFSSLKSGINMPIKNAFTYQAQICTGVDCPSVDTKPILIDSVTGNVLGALTKTADGRQIINLTMNHNSFLEHTGLMAYDLLSWVTQGTFIGERRYYLSLDVDDWYLSSDVWNPATNTNFTFEERVFRMSATDVYNTRDGILNLRSRFNVPNLNYNQVFNANGGDPAAVNNCSDTATLSEATLCVGEFFPWVSHTFTHADMDFLDYAGSRKEFEDNIIFAQGRLPDFDRQFLVTGRHSGLGWRRITDADGARCVVDQVPGDPYCQFGLQSSNPAMLQAAIDLGIKYLAANRGWITHEAACDTCLITHPLESSIKLIPRWPTNVFYNVTDPTENASEFNYLYGPNGIVRDGNGNPFFTTEQTWDQVLDFEANIAMRHILSGSPYPHFVHQGNLREYSPGRSLLYDWTEATLQVFDSYFSLPIISQDWLEMATTLEERTSFYNANATGVWDRSTNSVNISAPAGATVFVTGTAIPGASTFSYGNATVSVINPITIAASPPLPPSSNITVAPIGAQSTEEGIGVNLQVIAPAGATFSAAGLPTGLSIASATGLISGEANIPGLYTVTVFATNGPASGSQSFEWTITPDSVDVLGTNLLVNGGFEGSLDPWTDGACGTGTIASSTDAVEGDSALSLSTSSVCVSQAAAVISNQDYNLSCKTSNLGGTYADMSLFFFDAAGTSTLGGTKPLPATNYTEYTLTATVPETAIRAEVYIYVSGVGRLLVDDCVLQASEGTPVDPTPVDPTPVDPTNPTPVDPTNPTPIDPIIPTPTDPVAPVNLLINGGFEGGFISPWADGSCGAGKLATSTNSVEGTTALNMFENTACVNQSVLASADTIYTLSCEVNNLGGTYADMSLYFTDDSGTSTLGGATLISTSGYNQYSITATAPATATSASIYVSMEGTGQVLIDDCVLQTGTGTPTNPTPVDPTPVDPTTPTNPTPIDPTPIIDLPWFESFGQVNGATSDTDTTAWTSSRASGGFGVQDGSFIVENTGGEAVWQSEVINIASDSNGIAFSIDLLSSGSVRGGDYLRISYKLDGGAEVMFYEQTGRINRNDNFRVSEELPTAGTIEIVIRASTDANSESYSFDNVSLQER